MDTEKRKSEQPSLPNIKRGSRYPANRPWWFAARYQRLLLKTCTLMEIKHDGFVLCSLVALTEQSKRYTEPPRFWTKQLLELLSVKSRSSLCEIRDRCIRAGVLEYEAGHKGVACLMWTVMPPCWESQSDGFLDDGIVSAVADTIPSESRQHPVTIPSESRTHSLSSNSSYPSTTNATVVEDFEKRLLGAGVNLAGETIARALAHGTTLGRLNEVVDYYDSRPGAWGPGALVKRLTLKSAERLTPERGWDKPDKKEAQLKRTAANAVALRKAAETASSSSDTARWKQLEIDFGPLLDAMPAGELEQVVTKIRPQLLANLERYGAGSKMLRSSLLGVLAEAAEASR